jgi:large subunit ribosomal protein L23
MLIYVCRWDKTMYEAGQKERTEYEEGFQPGWRERPSKERGAMKEQAKALLSGKEKWKPTGRLEDWEDVGEAKEVETDVVLPKPER